MARIPLVKPTLTGREEALLRESLASGKLSGDGGFTARVRNLLEVALPAPAVLLTTSCTSALELAALLLRREDDEAPEAIVPAFTFVSTPNAFLLHGYRVVFCDVDVRTGNFDLASVERAITPRTRVIVPVHYAGIPGDMDALLALARPRGIAVVEDAAQAVFSRRNGREAGTFGDLACFSFHATKNFQSGEGGALVINRPELVARAEILREKGTNRSQFLQGRVDKYTWVDVGSSFLPADPLAAMLLPQLEDRAAITARRRAAVERYRAGLAPLVTAGRLQVLEWPASVEPNHHLFAVVLPSLAVRTSVMAALNAQGIDAAFHYPALHTTPMGRRVAPQTPSLPGAERLGDCLLRLPLFTDITEAQVDEVVHALTALVR